MANNRRILASVAVTLAACTPAKTPSAPPPRIDAVSRTGIPYIVEGSGPPVVLIHAFQMDAREWDEIAPQLAKSWRVIRYDVRGHGRSPVPAQPVGAHEDFRDLLDELKVPRASVVGLSMGAGIAL